MTQWYKCLLRAGELFEERYQAVLNNDEELMNEITVIQHCKCRITVEEDGVQYTFFLVNNHLPTQELIIKNLETKKERRYRYDDKRLLQLSRTLKRQIKRGIMIYG